MAKKKAEAVEKTNWDVLVEDSKGFWNNTVMKNQILFGIGSAVLLILAVVSAAKSLSLIFISPIFLSGFITRCGVDGKYFPEIY